MLMVVSKATQHRLFISSYTRFDSLVSVFFMTSVRELIWMTLAPIWLGTLPSSDLPQECHETEDPDFSELDNCKSDLRVEFESAPWKFAKVRR